jgi:hypothetical protein
VHAEKLDHVVLAWVTLIPKGGCLGDAEEKILPRPKVRKVCAGNEKSIAGKTQYAK